MSELPRVLWAEYGRRSVGAYPPSGYGTARDYAVWAFRASRWVRRVRVRSPRPLTARVVLIGPLGFAVPWRVRRRVADVLQREAPIGATLEVR